MCGVGAGGGRVVSWRVEGGFFCRKRKVCFWHVGVSAGWVVWEISKLEVAVTSGLPPSSSRGVTRPQFPYL